MKVPVHRLRACRSLTRCLDHAAWVAAQGSHPGLEGCEGGGRGRCRRDDDAVCLEQCPDLQQGAVHGGATAVEQHGERFRGQGDPQVKDGRQDLVGENESGRAAAPGVAIDGQGVGEIAQLLPGHAGQGGVGQ